MSNLTEFKIMRVRKGLTQVDVATAVGVSQQTVSDWESGKMRPRKDVREALARLYGVSVDELYSGNDNVSFAPTCDLCEELKKRDGVQEIWVAPYKSFEIINDGKKEQVEIDRGACRIFVVWD